MESVSMTCKFGVQGKARIHIDVATNILTVVCEDWDGCPYSQQSECEYIKYGVKEYKLIPIKEKNERPS